MDVVNFKEHMIVVWDFGHQPTQLCDADYGTAGRHWRRLLYPEARPVKQKTPVSHDLLSELTRALSRVPGTTLGSLSDLREAVHRFAERENRRGSPLSDTILAVHRELMTAEDDVMAQFLATEPRDPALARQVRAWVSEGYLRTQSS